MGAERAKAVWERVSVWLAFPVIGALIANAAVVLGETVLGGVGLAVGLCALLVILRQSWGWSPPTPVGALAVAAVGLFTMGPFVAVCGGALEGVISFPDVRFDQFDRASAVLFGAMYGGGWAWVRWKAFQQTEEDRSFAASPEHPGRAGG